MVAHGVLVAGVAVACGSSDNELSGGQGGTSSTTSSSTDSSSSSSTTTTNPESSFIALPCDSDADCGDDPDADCIQASENEPFFTAFFAVDDVVGGPAGGYCTKSCEKDADCPHDAVCTGDICIKECTFGEPPLTGLADPLSEDKCHGRDDLMCVPTQGGNALCIPVCGSDVECGGRACDLRTRVCTDAGREGVGLGSPCVPDDEATLLDEDVCAGICQLFVDDGDNSIHMCSASCSLGGAVGATHNCGGPDLGICAFGVSASDVSSALGDYGVCTAACAQHDDCNYLVGLFCLDLGLLDDVGKRYCYVALPCPLGNECLAGEGCLDTAFGPVCLEVDGNGDPLVPLGEAAGSGGAGGSGGA
jgi:hypothetical protein